MANLPLRRLSIVLGLFLFTGQAIALGGCVDSPENPSVVLGLLGAGAATLPWLRAQLRALFDRRH